MRSRAATGRRTRRAQVMPAPPRLDHHQHPPACAVAVDDDQRHPIGVRAVAAVDIGDLVFSGQRSDHEFDEPFDRHRPPRRRARSGSRVARPPGRTRARTPTTLHDRGVRACRVVGQRVSESRVRSGRRAVLFRVYLPCQHLRSAGRPRVCVGRRRGAVLCAWQNGRLEARGRGRARIGPPPRLRRAGSRGRVVRRPSAEPDARRSTDHDTATDDNSADSSDVTSSSPTDRTRRSPGQQRADALHALCLRRSTTTGLPKPMASASITASRLSRPRRTAQAYARSDNAGGCT